MPRLSLPSYPTSLIHAQSGGQQSITTLSSYDEVQTPRSIRNRAAFLFDLESKQVQGPRGPHLFRSSVSSTHSIELQHALSLSPLTPKVPNQTEYQLPIALDLTPLPTRKQKDGPFQYTEAALDTATLPEWSPEMVAQWMLNAGVELSACDRFVENDITGGILITLKFEDLVELGIPSFGVRTKVWGEIHTMRDIKPSEPVPETDIEDAPDREARREMRRQECDKPLKRGGSKRRPKLDDVISPLESVSIVGIEQMMPKPHNCSKGEKCRKWQRNKRMIEAFKQDHPFVNMEGGVIMVAGDPGNPETADAIRPTEEFFRPVSDAMPSVVASSDVMGPGSFPNLQHLAEATLRNVQARDPQDNVRQFLDFQRQHNPGSSEVPPTPPFEILPSQKPPHHGLQSLPKLTIPNQAPPVPRPQPSSAHPTSAVHGTAAAEEEEVTPTALYRFGTPFSDMDVPLTAIPTGPVARDLSQSVPPDMNYRHNPAPPPRSMSRASGRRPSFPVMPALDENSIVSPTTRQSHKSFAQRAAGSQPLKPPPRVQYPWTQADRKTFERAIAPIPGSSGCTSATTPRCKTFSPLASHAIDMAGTNPISYEGPMRKRKTKMLRHEWHDNYFTLRGTRLAMHRDATATNRTLEYIDIDDYAIACSSLASGKLNAAFRAMSILRGGENNSSSSNKADVAAFSFQLIPQDNKGGVRLRKRESSLPGKIAAAAAGAVGAVVPPPGEGVNGTGKTHHFAVKSRDERIDWMRELMLAKALRQKGEGFEVSVNGNMI